MKVYIDYDVHPDRGGAQMVYEVGTLHATPLEASALVGQIIRSASRKDDRLELEIEQFEEPCRHQRCRTVSGRKRDYLYCEDCETALESTGE